MPDQTIHHFSEIDSQDTYSFGAIGTKFASLFQSGFPIPDGFIITPDAFAFFLKENKLDTRIKKLLTTVHFDYPETLPQIEAHITKMFDEARFSQQFSNELTRYLNRIGAGEFSLRTYALTLGNPKESEQHISPEDTFLEKLKESWAKHFSASLLAMRHIHNLDHLSPGVVTIIQKQIQPTKSGKILTTDSANPRKQTQIILHHAELGTDKYILSKKNKTILDRTLKLHHANSPTLSFHELYELGLLATAVEKHLFFPQGIEWAFVGKKLFLLQTKPQTEEVAEEQEKPKKHALMRGLGVTKNIGTGVIAIIHTTNDLQKVKPHDLVVISHLEQKYMPLLKNVSGIITEKGDIHSEVSAYLRKHAVPTIYNVRYATKILKNGVVMIIHAGNGEIYAGGYH